MRLFGTPASPYVRKVRIVLEEKRIPYEYVVARGSAPGSPVPRFNPLGKIPTLVLDSGRPVYDSPVIAEYLDGLVPEPRLIPEAFEERMAVKCWEALGDGVVEATVAVSHEYREPREKRRGPEWFARQQEKIDRGLTVMAQDLGDKEYCFGDGFSLADVAAGCALGYLDYALPEYEWRGAHPELCRLAERLDARQSFGNTVQTK